MNENLNKNKKENKEVKKDCITCKYWPYPYYGSPCLECSDCEDEDYKYWEPEEKIKNMMMMMRTLCQGTLFRHPF